MLRIEGLYEVLWRVLGITEEEMSVKISLAFYRTFGAVGLLFMFKERYIFLLDLCLSSWTNLYSLTCIDILNFHGVPFASCLGFSLERCYPAEWSSMVDVCGFNTNILETRGPSAMQLLACVLHLTRMNFLLLSNSLHSDWSYKLSSSSSNDFLPSGFQLRPFQIVLHNMSTCSWHGWLISSVTYHFVNVLYAITNPLIILSNTDEYLISNVMADLSHTNEYTYVTLCSSDMPWYWYWWLISIIDMSCHVIKHLLVT